MKTFRLKVDLTCPSDWTLEQARVYIQQQLLSTKEEIASAQVEEVQPVNQVGQQ